MSSLLQFNGRSDRRGVGLIFCAKPGSRYSDDGGRLLVPQFRCSICGKWHERLFEAFRKPCGMLGCWVVFRYNGKEQVPDLSVPIDVDKLPKGARMMSIKECERHWHSPYVVRQHKSPDGTVHQYYGGYRGHLLDVGKQHET